MKRRYTDEERANALAALAANGGNVERTAGELDIPRKTLEHWAKGERHPEAANMGQLKKGPLADTLEGIAWALAGMIQPAAEKAKAKGAVGPIATAFGIIVDKMRLLRDQSTSITTPAEMTDEQCVARLRELAERIRQRRLGPAHAPGTNGSGAGSGRGGAA